MPLHVDYKTITLTVLGEIETHSVCYLEGALLHSYSGQNRLKNSTWHSAGALNSGRDSSTNRNGGCHRWKVQDSAKGEKKGWVTVNKTWNIHSSVYLYLRRMFLALFSSPPPIFILLPLLYVPINYKSENIHEQMTGSGMLLACHARSPSLNYSVLFTEHAMCEML